MNGIVYDAEDLTPQVGDNSMGALLALLQEAREAEAGIAQAEDALKTAKHNYKDIIERRFPEAMDDLGLQEVTVQDGSAKGCKLTIKETLRAGTPEATRELAFKWLEDNKQGSIIKNEIKLQFNRGEEAKAQDVRDALIRKGLTPESKRSVHPQTLQATLSEMLKNGVDVPLPLFGGILQREVKIK